MANVDCALRKPAQGREDLTEALLDSASETFDRARSRAVERLREPGLSGSMAVLSLVATLTDAAERCAELPRKRRGQSGDRAEALAEKVVPFRCDLR